MSEAKVFDPRKVQIQQYSQGCMAEQDGYVDELEWGTLLLLYEDAVKTLENEERAHTQTIRERDAAEDAMSDAYLCVTGRASEWSNVFSYDDALNEIAQRMKDVGAH